MEEERERGEHDSKKCRQTVKPFIIQVEGARKWECTQKTIKEIEWSVNTCKPTQSYEDWL